MPLRLILNADDFGLSEGINRAVEELYLGQALTSATLMAGGPAFDHSVLTAMRCPGLAIGCHLVFVDGDPVADARAIPSLLGKDGESFRTSYTDFARAALFRAVRGEDVATEAEAQIRKLQAAGIHVTHVDSHKHTHLLPGITRPVLEAAARCGVRAFRDPFEPQWSRDAVRSLVPLRRRAEQGALDLFQRTFRRAADRFAAQPGTTSGTLGIAATGTLDSAALRCILSAALKSGLDNTYELCCHPGYNDADLARLSTRLRASRQIELRALLAVIPELSRSEQGLRLIHYGDLAAFRM